MMSLQDVIEKNRRELLDLSARNRLVHTPLEGKRKSWLSIDDERSEQLFDLLARQGKSLSFLPKVTPESEDNAEREQFLKVFNESAATTLLSPGSQNPQSSASEPEARHTDHFLQTHLEKDALESQLLRMFYDARTGEEEQGASILYLALGFLKWREADSSEAYRYAPLLLIPVDLSRNSARSQFRLKFRDEEIATNLSIQARLLQDFGIRIPDIPEEAIDNKDWTPLDYFQEIKERIQSQTGWEVLEHEILLWFFSFTKFLMYRDLSPAAWPEEADLCQNPLIQGLLVDGFGEIESLPPLVGEDEPIDRILSPADVIHVTDADSSQAIVIAEIAQGRNLVVQGPPGTGKSQTITNAIAAAVHAGKRVLFISEKMAALDVVKRRLDEIGLGPMTLELHSHKARKREVLENLKATLELGNPKGNRSVPLEELRTKANRLREHDRLLHSPIGKSECTPYQAMGRLIALKNSGTKPRSYSIPKMIDWSPEEYEARKQVADDLDRLLNVSGSPLGHAWRGIRCAPMIPTDLERFAGRLMDAKAHLEELENANVDLAHGLGLPKPVTFEDAENLIALAKHIGRCPLSADREALGHPRWDTDMPAIEQALANLKQLVDERNSIADRVSEAAWSTDLAGTRIALAAHGKRWFRFFNSSYRQAVAMLRGLCQGPAPKDADERVKLVDRILSVQSRRKRLEQDEELGRSLLGRLWAGEATRIPEAESVANWVKAGEASAFVKEHQRQVAQRLKEQHRLDEPLNKAVTELDRSDRELKTIATDLKLDFAAAFGCDESKRIALGDWLTKIATWLLSTEELSHYLATRARISKLDELGLCELAREVDQGEVQAGEAVNVLEMIRSEAVLKRAWEERPWLAEFHGEAFEGDRARFAELDLQRIVLSRLEVAKNHHDNLPSRTADTGQVGVLRWEMGKQRRHKPLRKLLKEAGHAIQKIKPVFMMSPLSVAQFLEPGAVEFDLLVIDEASQVQPVDALGAIARCKQIVVVGDQKQLPPTSFFARLSGEAEDNLEEEAADEAVSAGDLESILGLCEAQGLPNRMLRWHYRSRHESLIAVSNRQFYDDRLFIVPSPMVAGGPLGLKFHYVANGWYDRGGSRTNRNEAIAVADAVMKHATEYPQLSLGVATFSTAQRDAIIDEIELRRRNDPTTEGFFASGGPEPFFVKSLENVQGDQRDVIFISVGYAKDQGGYFAQNFGPLNRKGGERRLNVLISRAASACEVFSSLKADDIDLSRTQSVGVMALKLYLNYAAHGRMDAVQSLGDADSLFEEQVGLAIRSQGWEVDHQIGVGGFFIDLAIRDPNRRGRYLLGIECDGAQYHSARWVRDRDRLRQQILETRGWVIHRIWSTDWFKRPKTELERVLKSLEKAKSDWDAVDQREKGSALPTQRSHRTVDANAFWEREESGDADAAAQNGEPECVYREAANSLTEFRGNPADMPLSELVRVIKGIVEIEAPIHREEIGRRCIKHLGAGRLGNTLKLKLESAVKLLEDQGDVIQKEAFIHLPGVEKYPIRNRRSLENATLRKIDYIPPEELREAILKVVSEHIAPDETETSSSVAKLLGISNHSTVQNAVKEQVAILTAENALSERAGKLFIG